MLDIEKSCLIVVDVQGRLAELMHDKESLFVNIGILIKTANTLAIPILWCEQNPKALGPTIPQLAELLVSHKPIEKFSFSCLGNKNFSDKLKTLKAKQFIICKK